MRLRKLTATDGAVHVGVELEYRVGAQAPTRLPLGLDPEGAVRLEERLVQLGEKPGSPEP